MGVTPKLKTWSTAEVEQHIAGLKTKTTPTGRNANLFEIEQTGPLNYEVIGGGRKIYTDGIEGTELQEAKHVGNVKNSPYVKDSKASSYIRAKVLAKQQDEFERYAAVIHDPTVPFESLSVLANDPTAVPYFQELLDIYKIPGKVKVVPTNISSGRRSK